MKPLDRLRTFLTAKTSASADLVVAAEQARTEATNAGAEVARLGGERRSILLDGSDDALAKHDEAAAGAARRRDRAGALADELHRKAAEAAQREAEEARLAAYMGAKAKGEAASKLLAKEYPELVRRAALILRELAEAEAAILTANAALPAGLEPLPSPEHAVRSRAGLPREEVSEREVDLWCLAGHADPVADEYQRAVARNPDGSGYRSTAGGSDRYERRRFKRTEYRPAVAGVTMDRLATKLALPALRAGEPNGWRPFGDYATTPADVLARLDELAAEGDQRRAAEPSREVRVEHVYIGKASAPKAVAA